MNFGSIKQRTWFTFAVDFCVIVAAVFVGILIADWNDARREVQRSEALTSRLIDDLADEAWIYHYIVSYHEDVLGAAMRTQDALLSDAGLVSEAFLIDAYRASQYTWWKQRRGTFDELVSTGALGLIRDEDLRRIALEVYSSPLQRDIAQAGQNSLYRALFRQQVPTDVQRALGKACGDLAIPFGVYGRLSEVLSYECTPELSQAQIETSARALTENPEFAPTLRLRIANLETELADLKEDGPVMQWFTSARAAKQP